MGLTVDQVAARAGDARTLSAARATAASPRWSALGVDSRAIWGRCQGRRPYDVVVDLRDLGATCSCPSRQSPCKHGLALMLLAAGGHLTDVASAAPPSAATAWLEDRAARASRRRERAERPRAPPDAEARARRRSRLQTRALDGIGSLDRWLRDLLRGGLAGLEAAGFDAFERQAARLVDAQVPGLARRVRALADLPGRGPDWPEHMLSALGRIALITEGFARRSSLPSGLAVELETAVGWTLRRDDVLRDGKHVTDRWTAIGQVVERVEAGLRARRSWLLGEDSDRLALLLEFARGDQRFASNLREGQVVDATLAFWPGAAGRRALIAETSSPATRAEAPAACADLSGFLDEVAAALARCPWQERFAGVVREVRPTWDDGVTWLVDRSGAGLRLSAGEHWPLRALSGGHPLPVVALEYDGDRLTPIGAWVDGRYHALAASPDAARPT